MFHLTRHGWREMLIGSILLIGVGIFLGWATNLWWIGLIVLPVLVWLFAFFRDPHRAVPTQPNVMVSPADGVVSDITEIPYHELLGGPCVRVGIFLSVFNVHLNRAPCDAKVLDLRYVKGRFINAMKHDDASSQNESNTIVLGQPDQPNPRPIAVVKQIVGLIARRIICDCQIDQDLQRGQRIGMIKFGSRTELYIPTWLQPRIKVQIGQKVRGASDIIAWIDPATGPHKIDADIAAPQQSYWPSQSEVTA